MVTFFSSVRSIRLAKEILSTAVLLYLYMSLATGGFFKYSSDKEKSRHLFVKVT